jgi:3',5'-cyclic AMP phosphodiesterase CpdA
MDRRSFLGTAAVSTFTRTAAAQPAGFTFVHLTDTHIQPELRGGEGTHQAIEAINRVPHDFSLCGGDLVMDVCEVTPDRAKALFDLYASATKDLRGPVHSIPGNHDVYGNSNKSAVPASDPQYGKKLYEDRMGARYGSFNHKGWHFIRLDSIFVTPEKTYEGRIDDAQIDWLKSDLAKTPASTPIVVTTHIPFITAFGQVIGAKPETLKSIQITNAKPVLDLFQGHALKAVLQGHTHIREVIDYNGAKFITSGAVCGNWWKGPHLGHPEGFGVLTVRGGEISWEYRTYGWKAAI